MITYFASLLTALRGAQGLAGIMVVLLMSIACSAAKSPLPTEQSMDRMMKLASEGYGVNPGEPSFAEFVEVDLRLPVREDAFLKLLSEKNLKPLRRIPVFDVPVKEPITFKGRIEDFVNSRGYVVDHQYFIEVGVDKTGCRGINFLVTVDKSQNVVFIDNRFDYEEGKTNCPNP